MTLPSENGTDAHLTPQQEAAIHLPMSLFRNIHDQQNVGMFFTFYNMSTLFPVGKHHTENSVQSRVEVGSSVIAATVGGDSSIFENLTEAVQISFRMRKVYARLQIFSCYTSELVIFNHNVLGLHCVWL